MTTPEIAFALAVALMFALAAIIAAMRGQVHAAQYSNEEVSPWSERYVNSLLGQYGIWQLHKRFCLASRLRLWFGTISITLFACLAVGVCSYLYDRR